MINTNKGFTLVEVLVTVVIMSLGLLGLAGLQIRSLQDNFSAEQRGKAAQLSSDMVDRMRSNIANRSNLGDLNAYTGIAAEDAGCTASPGCTSTEQAGHDIFEWQREISFALPLGQGTISEAGGVYSITVEWDDNRDGAVGADDASYEIRFEP